MKPVAPGDFSGRFIHYGIREHGMAAAMNGIALHGGLIPYSGTFLVFADYCRPSLRLAAIMGQRVVQVFTHDSIGVGEDGPTHQPVEHLAALRAIPNMNVFRPADLTETAECWQLALERNDGPSILALTRQNLPALRLRYVEENVSARGAYELSPASEKAEVSIFASGSEVSLAIAAQAALEKQGVPTRVVSVPMNSSQPSRIAASTATIAGALPSTCRRYASGWARNSSKLGTDTTRAGTPCFSSAAWAAMASETSEP
jgi:transketolase